MAKEKKVELVEIIALEGAKHLKVGEKYTVSPENAKVLIGKKWAKLAK